MGVELGKVLAKNILSQLNQPSDVTGHDSSVRVYFRCASEFSLTKSNTADYWSYSLLPKVPKRMNHCAKVVSVEHGRVLGNSSM
jgi:hypothetical protein